MSRRKPELSALEDKIGYHFSDRSWLERALTHISALKTGVHADTYQRLEFLGDHVLGLAISDLLFRAFPGASEGQLSRRLSDLVRAETCAEVARTLDLGPWIRLGPSEVRSGGRKRASVLADVCESLIGAVFLDGGYEPARDFVERFWRERMMTKRQPPLDPKTTLQEWAQAQGLPGPIYREIARTGPHHRPEFRISVELADRAPAEGLGRSKRAAEQAAAAAMLTRENIAKVHHG